jgi:hypothetical protein
MVEKKTLCLLRRLSRIRRSTTLLLITWHTLVAKTRVNHGQTGLLEVGSLERGALGHWPPTPARTPCARPPRSPPHGPGRRGNLPPTGLCTVGPPSSNRPLRPYPPTPRVHTRRAGHPTATPPYTRCTVPGWLLAVAPPPCPCHGPLFGDARDPLAKARLSIKGGRFSPRASTEPSAIGAPAVNPVIRPVPRHPKLRTSSLGLPRAATGTSCPAFPFPSLEFELPRPSPGSPNPARASAYSPSQWVLVAPPLARTEALYTTHCSAEPFPLPDFAPSRPCCPCAAAAARRRPLRPSYHRQSLCGELNRRPV